MKFAATLLIASAAAIKLAEPDVDLQELTPAEIEQGLEDLAAACEADPEASGCDELAELAELDTDEILDLLFGSSSDSGSGSDDDDVELAQVASSATSGETTDDDDDDSGDDSSDE